MMQFKSWLEYTFDPENVLDDEELQRFGPGANGVIKKHASTVGNLQMMPTVKMQNASKFGGKTITPQKNNPIQPGRRVNSAWR